MVTYDDIASAAEQIRGVAHRTPVATSRLLDAACGNRMLLKCETCSASARSSFAAHTTRSAG